MPRSEKEIFGAADRELARSQASSSFGLARYFLPGPAREALRTPDRDRSSLAALRNKQRRRPLTRRSSCL